MNFTQCAHPYAQRPDRETKWLCSPSFQSPSPSAPLPPSPSTPITSQSLPACKNDRCPISALQVSFTCFRLLHECEHMVPSWLLLFPFSHHCTCTIDPCCRGDSSCSHSYVVSRSVRAHSQHINPLRPLSSI